MDDVLKYLASEAGLREHFNNWAAKIIAEALADKNGPVQSHCVSAVAPQYIKKKYKVSRDG